MRRFTKSVLTLLCLMVGSVNAFADEEIALTQAMFQTWNGYGADAVATGAVTVDFNIGNDAEISAGGMVCGTSTVDYLTYADITGSSKLVIEGTAGLALRVLMNRQESNSGPLVEKNPTIGENGKVELDLTDLTYVHINAIKLGWSSPAGKVNSIKFVKPSDPLAVPKEALKKVIGQAKLYSSIAMTEASFAVLTQAISDGEAALADAGATSESLTNAATAITNAIDGLTFAEGFSSLKDVAFGSWNGWGADAEMTQPGTPAWTLFEATGQPYGDPSVNAYADLSAFDKLYIVAVSGTPRILLNRDADGGQWSETESESHLIDNTKGGWSAKYFAQNENVYTVDLKQLVADKGFAHLTSIKGANYADVTVTGMYLYKAPVAPAFEPAYGTIWENGETATDGDYTLISLNKGYFQDFAKVADTLKVDFEVVAAARAARNIKKGEISFWADGNELFSLASIMPEVKNVDIVLTEEMITKLAAAEQVTLKYKNMAVAKVALVEKVAEPEPVNPIAEGKYYLYNVAAHGYVVGANNWGTRASISQTGGIEFEAVLTDNKYELKSAPLYAGKHLGFNGYVDNGDAANWTIVPVEGQEGVFTLTTDGTNVLFWDGGQTTTTSVGVMPETAANAYWKFVTKAEREALFAEASTENPVDATFYISAPNASRGISMAAWTNVNNSVTFGGDDANNVAESYMKTFDFSQQLTNIPNGLYQLKAQAAVTFHDNRTIKEYDGNGYPVIFAGDSTANFNDMIAADRLTNMSQISNQFTAGEYNVQPITVKVIDGTLTIGAKSERADIWAIFDNFELSYCGAVEIDLSEFVTLYENALAAAREALADEKNAVVTGDERTALNDTIEAYTTVEQTQEALIAAAAALNATTATFIAAKADYQALVDTKASVAAYSFKYASANKKAAAEASVDVTATNAADAKEKAAAILKAYRQYAESSALAEGVEGAKNMTDSITNPNAEEAVAAPWITKLGEGSGGSIGILQNEPYTDGDDVSAHKYFDGGNWGANAWDVALEQEITLPAGKYQLTVTARAEKAVDFTLYAGEAQTKLATISSVGGLFNRGWNDGSVEFEMAEDGNIIIGVHGVTSEVHNWMSFTRFRLVQLEEKAIEVAHTWNFTKWSEATVANLKAEAAKGMTEGLWSDAEKADGTATTMEISKDNCFWQVGTSAADGEELTANGEVIAELKGLKFKNNKARSLAIAVNYGDCTSANGDGFGPYYGASYLWLGSKNVEYFTIPAVLGGTTIKMGVESHKLTDARGVQLFAGETELKDANGDAVAAPTTYTEQTWVVPEGNNYDIVVKNTNGCHIYFIDAEQDPTAVGISAVKNSDRLNGVIYNLNGQKVNKAQKGLYIIDGKKMFVK